MLRESQVTMIERWWDNTKSRNPIVKMWSITVSPRVWNGSSCKMHQWYIYQLPRTSHQQINARLWYLQYITKSPFFFSGMHSFSREKWNAHHYFNLLWPSNAIWRYRFGSKLAQIMACCLAAPSHYLTHSWLIFSKAQWHSSQGNFTRDTSATNH